MVTHQYLGRKNLVSFIEIISTWHVLEYIFSIIKIFSTILIYLIYSELSLRLIRNARMNLLDDSIQIEIMNLFQNTPSKFFYPK